MNKIIILISIFILFSLTLAASETTEFYFKFTVNSQEEIIKLTKIISIDNVIGKEVYAYANPGQFQRFKDLNYAYEILPHPGSLIQPEMASTKERMREWDSYPTYEAYIDMMYEFEENFPELCVIENIGPSVEGRDLLFARISDNLAEAEDEPEFMFTATMHGNETTGYVLMLRLIDYLLENYGIDPRVTNLVDNIEIWINPLANPDGTYHGGNQTVYGATRFNANGVDLNRNFPDPEDGPHPDGNQWQPETVAMMDLAHDYNFVLSANFHGGAEVVNYPWDTWPYLHADDDWFQIISHTYADAAQANSPPGYMDGFNDGITNGYQWYTINGGRQDYMNYFHSCREVTIEISNTMLLPANLLPAHWDYNQESFLLYMEECLYGFRGIVSNEDNNPLDATVYVIEHEIYNSEVFTDPEVGNYHRMIAPGTYDIDVSACGYSSQIIYDINITDLNITLVDVELEPHPDAIHLTGLVKDISTDEPIPDARIEILSEPVSPVYTNTDGEYSFYLFEDTYSFYVTAEDYLDMSIDLEISESNNYYDFEMSTGPLIGVNPSSIEKEMFINETDTEYLTITNIGGGTLDYTIRTEELTGRDLTGSYIQCSTETFYPGETVDWIFTVYNQSPDNEWVTDVYIDFPTGVYVNSATDLIGGSGGDMLYDGTTGEGVEINWHGETYHGYGVLHEGESALAEIDVTISSEFSGNINLTYQIVGDEFGEEPHTVSGIMSLSYPLSWISLNTSSGTLVSGASDEIEIYFDTNGLEEGVYYCDIVISNESRHTVIVPVTLNVNSSEIDTYTVPDVIELFANYPNPFNPAGTGRSPETTISFNLTAEDVGLHSTSPGQAKNAELIIYNVKGQRVKTFDVTLSLCHPACQADLSGRNIVKTEAGRRLERSRRARDKAGTYSVIWDGTDEKNQPVASGIYMYKLQSGKFSVSKKMTLIR
jgi:murein tripeptide amidase MpaA